MNPIAYVTKDDPPFLIVHGDKDPVVPINQSQLLFDALKMTEVSAHFHTIHGAGHGGPGFAGKNIEEMVSQFFAERLKSSSAKVEALTTESTADVTTTERDPRKGMPPAGGRRGIPWEVIAGRDDKNKDGKVTKDEFSGPPQLFQRLEKKGDGALTREEHEGSQPPAPTPPLRPGESIELRNSRQGCAEMNWLQVSRGYGMGHAG